MNIPVRIALVRRIAPAAAALLYAAFPARAQDGLPQRRSYSVDQVRKSCIDFANVKLGTNSYDVGECRVSSFGALGTVGGQVYYYALYCLLTNDRLAEGHCGDTSFVGRSHRNRGLAVFAGDRGSATVRLAYERVNPEVGIMVYAQPEILRTGHGTFLYLPIRVDGTGSYNESEYYLRAGGAWQRLDSESWLKDLASRLPPGREIWKGVWPNLATLRAESGLWRKGDGNCCPTGGQVRVRLAIRDRRFVIVSAVVDTTS